MSRSEFDRILASLREHENTVLNKENLLKEIEELKRQLDIKNSYISIRDDVLAKQYNDLQFALKHAAMLADRCVTLEYQVDRLQRGNTIESDFITKREAELMRKLEEANGQHNNPVLREVFVRLIRSGNRDWHGDYQHGKANGFLFAARWLREAAGWKDWKELVSLGLSETSEDPDDQDSIIGDYEVDPADSEYLSRLRSCLDDHGVWPSEEVQESGDYEACVRHMAELAKRQLAKEEKKRLPVAPPKPSTPETALPYCGECQHFHIRETGSQMGKCHSAEGIRSDWSLGLLRPATSLTEMDDTPCPDFQYRNRHADGCCCNCEHWGTLATKEPFPGVCHKLSIDRNADDGCGHFPPYFKPKHLEEFCEKRSENLLNATCGDCAFCERPATDRVGSPARCTAYQMEWMTYSNCPVEEAPPWENVTEPCGRFLAKSTVDRDLENELAMAEQLAAAKKPRQCCECSHFSRPEVGGMRNSGGRNSDSNRDWGWCDAPEPAGGNVTADANPLAVCGGKFFDPTATNEQNEEEKDHE